MRPEESRGAIKGRVLRDGQPVMDVPVSITEGPSHPDIAALTGANGEYMFNDLEPGYYVIQAYMDNANAVTKKCTVAAGQTTVLDLS